MKFADNTITVGRKSRKNNFIDDGTIQTSKEYQKYLASHDEEQAEALLQKSDAELKNTISYCTVEIREQTEEVEKNEGYQNAKSDLKVFTDGLKEVLKPLKTTINLAAMLLKDRGQMINPDSLEGAVQALKDAAGPDTKIFVSKAM